MVPLRTALAQSYNAASARLGTEVGIDKVLANVQRLGVERELKPFAATLLGATDMSPFEVAQMYHTIATGGFRTPLKAIREVTLQDGTPVRRYPLAVEQAFAARADVPARRRDAGRGARRHRPGHEGVARRRRSRVAGKTGTTDEQRDAWFAGFTGDRVAVVWLGYDDNRAARLSGAASALPVWGELIGLAQPRAARAAQARRHRERADRSRLRPARRLLLQRRARASLRAGLRAERRARPCASEIGVAVEQVKEKAKGFFERLFGR